MLKAVFNFGIVYDVENGASFLNEAGVKNEDANARCAWASRRH
jgi:hypothetical protein